MISIITATFNNQNTLQDALNSVRNQTYKNIEHIIVDGNSTDNTLKIVRKFKHIKKIISERDNGLYDALNKGIELATGDIIGILHADDFFYDNYVIEKIANVFVDENIDAVYGDLIYINDRGKMIRYWKSSPFEKKLLRKGWMPPHPTLFLKKEIYDRFGLFDTSYQIAADYEFVLRIFTAGIKAIYLPEVFVKMRLGGKSNRNLKNILLKSKEDFKSIKRYSIGGLGVLLRKNFSKITQFLYT